MDPYRLPENIKEQRLRDMRERFATATPTSDKKRSVAILATLTVAILAAIVYVVIYY